MQKIPHFRAIQVEPVRETNTRPARVKIFDLWRNQTIIISYVPDGAANYLNRAVEYLAARGINIVSHATTVLNKAGYPRPVAVLFSDNFETHIK